MYRNTLTKLSHILPQQRLLKPQTKTFFNLQSNKRSSSYLSLTKNSFPIFQFSTSNDKFPGESQEQANLRIQKGQDEEYKVQTELKRRPKNYMAHYHLGEIYRMYFRQNKEAIESYLKAIELKPLYWKAYGSLLALDPELTIKKLQEVNEKNPHYYAEYHIGIALYNLKRYEEALERFQKTNELNPKFTAGLAWSAIVLEGQKKYEEAIKKYEGIIELGAKGDPIGLSKTPYALYHWSIALRRQGKYEEAVKKLEKAFEKLWEDREFLDTKEYLLKEIEERKSKIKGAEELEKSLEKLFSDTIYEGFDMSWAPKDEDYVDYSYLTEIYPSEIKEITE